MSEVFEPQSVFSVPLLHKLLQSLFPNRKVSLDSLNQTIRLSQLSWGAFKLRNCLKQSTVLMQTLAHELQFNIRACLIRSV